MKFNASKTALLIIDLQNDILTNGGKFEVLGVVDVQWTTTVGWNLWSS